CTWWGETKLRTLLGKHKDIEQRYFDSEIPPASKKIIELLATLVESAKATAARVREPRPRLLFRTPAGQTETLKVPLPTFSDAKEIAPVVTDDEQSALVAEYVPKRIEADRIRTIVKNYNERA